MKSRTLLVLAAASLVLVLAADTAMACAGCGCRAPKPKAEEKAAELKPQTMCPVMGGKINKKQYTDVKGKRIYVCCPGCLATIEADPDKYIAVIEKAGETPENTPAPKCKHCGAEKGSDKCCK